jgi:GT2 family glycosyltransferase
VAAPPGRALGGVLPELTAEPRSGAVRPPPTVSVVIPTHNRARQVVSCVRAVLTQPYRDLEVLVADDHSEDDTVTLLRQVEDDRLRVLETDTNSGPSAARNRAVQVARGEVVFFVDDDVIVDPDWLRNGIRYFSDPAVAGIEGKVVYVDEQYRPRYSDRVVENLAGGLYMTANAAYRRGALLEVGLFDRNLRKYQDRDIALKVRRLGQVAFAPDVVVRHRAESYTVRSFMFEAAKIRYWLLLQDLHQERRGYVGPFYEPGKLLGVLLPPLVVTRLFAKRFTGPLDFLLFLLIWPRLVYERVLIWRWAVSKRRLII